MNSSFFQKIIRYFCPPGDGVFTVHTAKENKEKLQKKLYQTTLKNEVLKKWQESFQDFEKDKRPCLIGICADTGGGIQRGANWGPLFIRNTFKDAPFFDIGDIRVIPHLLHDKYLNEKTLRSCQQALYKEGDSQALNLPVSPLSIAQDFSEGFHSHYPHKNLLALGGDHSVSYSLVKPWILAKKKQALKVAIIHFDAHTDLMSERLGIDICFGSWAYHMLPHLDSPQDLIQFGIRASAQEKKYWEEGLGVQQFWANEINLEPETILKKTISYLKKKKIDELYISFDIDALDSKYASATGTPEPGGLTPEICCKYIKELSREFKVTGADLVEVAPFVATNHTPSPPLEPQSTLRSAHVIVKQLLEAMS